MAKFQLKQVICILQAVSVKLIIKDNKMSIDIEKIIEVYGCCITLFKAKQNLFIDSSQLNTIFERPQINEKQIKNHYLQIVEDGILKIVGVWVKKMRNFQSLQEEHKHTITQLQFKLQNLQNNSQILTKQDQTISQIQTIMRQWRQNMNPIQYYNTKYRKNMKREIEQKLQFLKLSTHKHQSSASPVYLRKIENEFRQNLAAAYYEQTKIDRSLIDATMKLYNQQAQQIGRIDDSVDSNMYRKQLSAENNRFLNQAHEIITRASRPSDRRLKSYSDSLIDALKINYNYWSDMQKGLEHQIVLLQQVISATSKIKANFEQKQDRIHKLLDDVSSPVINLFQANIIYSIIKSLNVSYDVAEIFTSFREKLIKRRQFAIKMINQCRDYLSRVGRQAKQRYDNFHHFAIVDKKFFDDQAKSEKIVTRLIVQSFKQFLQQCYKLIKDNRKIFYYSTKQEILQPNQLDYYLQKLSLTQNDDLSTNDSRSKDHKPHSKKVNTPNSELQSKIQKVQQFLGTIQIFRSDSIPQSEKSYSCALGPKLLLHGKLYKLQEGLFFESHFNKKNLLFGKTKLFIPRTQISDIDMKSTLLVFPDAVIIKTNHGIVSFHALGQQKAISNAIKGTYLEEQAATEQNVGISASTNAFIFKPFDESKRLDDNTIQKRIQSFENVVFDGLLKGSKVPIIFHRYFSDNPFQFNGVQYKTFKQYAMTLIEAKNPSSTLITPPPPTYLSYVTQQSPQNHYPATSNRDHSYGKTLPKIPLLSKGGEGKCLQKQTYYWLGPNAFVIQVLSTIEGFSLTQNMQVFIKYTFKEVDQGVKATISAQVKFTKESSSNGLVRNPTISNIKESMGKIMGTIQKCEKRKQAVGQVKSSANGQNQVLMQQVTTNGQSGPGATTSNTQIQLTKQQLQYLVAGFVVFYILTLIFMKVL